MATELVLDNPKVMYEIGKGIAKGINLAEEFEAALHSSKCSGRHDCFFRMMFVPHCKSDWEYILPDLTLPPRLQLKIDIRKHMEKLDVLKDLDLDPRHCRDQMPPSTR